MNAILHARPRAVKGRFPAILGNFGRFWGRCMAARPITFEANLKKSTHRELPQEAKFAVRGVGEIAGSGDRMLECLPLSSTPRDVP
jgi:hypothetical protein